VGGLAETFAASEDLFRAMGKNVFHVGGLGHGLAMKLINNMLDQIATVAIAEALVFGKKAGLDPQKIYEVMRVSTGSSVQFENWVPRMLARNFVPGARLTSRTRTKSSKQHLPSTSACHCCSPT
jgi:3-hydroxyisobutyrate dehydrogenase-like beta-hydroxyacid dehydrogenase